MKEQSWEDVHKKRRIIMNNDGFDCEDCPEGPKDAETFLSKRTSALVGSQVDAIFYCTGVFNLYHHSSAITETLKWDWAWELKRIEGRDSLEIMTDFGRRHGIEIFWSMRMNDVHDAEHPGLRAEWKTRHLEYLMGYPGEKFPYGDERAWSAVNYALPQVRQKVFDILEDVCGRYDINGIELDFFRHPVFFKEQLHGNPVTQAQCDLMTDLLGRVRSMTRQRATARNRPLLVAVRVPDSFGYAKALGLDAERWLSENLVDLIIGGCYFVLEPWENLVAKARKAGVPAYACLSGSRLVDASYPTGTANIDLMRGEARRAWDADIDGIYTFNRFDPNDPIFRELGDPDMLPPSQHRTYPGDMNLIKGYLKGGERFLQLSGRPLEDVDDQL